jgi:hypothetical protein
VNVLIPTPTAEEYQTFFTYATCWTIFYIAFHFSIVFMLNTKWMVPWCKDMSSKKKEELPGYIVGLIHHIGISPACLFLICRDFITFANTGGSAFESGHYMSLYSPSGLYPFTVAYFVADLIVFALPEAIKPGFASKLFLIHHCVALCMIYATFTLAQGSLTQVFPGMMCTELSTIFFNIAWILRAFGFRELKIVTLFESLFAFFFILLRNGHLTLLIYVLWYDIAGFGMFQVAILISTGLQFFWAYKIVLSLVSSKKKMKKDV